MFDPTYLSSSIDWCENNYEISSLIVEFVNSWTSLFITLVGIIGMHYHPTVSILYATLILIGITSFYFHATLSEAGQMADELSIMMAIISTTIYINTYILQWIPNNYILFLSIVKFGSMFIFPEFNRFILFTWGMLILRYVKYFYNMSSDKIRNNILVAFYYFILAVFCWSIDFMCLYDVSILYLHGWWHIFIGMCGYYVFAAIDYMTIETYNHLPL